MPSAVSNVCRNSTWCRVAVKTSVGEPGGITSFSSHSSAAGLSSCLRQSAHPH